MPPAVLPKPSANATSQPEKVSSNYMSAMTGSASNLPAKIVMHGDAGIGKTSWAACAPNPVFIMSPGENGIDTLIGSGQVSGVSVLPEVRNWEMLMSMIDELTHAEHQFQTLVVDTFSGLDAVCEEFVVGVLCNGDRGPSGYNNYGFGPNAKFAEWNNFLSRLSRLREARKMRVILLGHTKVGTSKNPMGLDYGRFVPNMWDKTWDRTFGWCDICLFAQFFTEVTGEGKSPTKGKAKGGTQRIMYTTNAAGFAAKNRHGLQEEIEMGESHRDGWNAFVEAMKEAKNRMKGGE